MKPDKIREMSPDELRGKERELQEQLFRLRFQKSIGQLDDAGKIRDTRRDIARDWKSKGPARALALFIFVARIERSVIRGHVSADVWSPRIPLRSMRATRSVYRNTTTLVPILTRAKRSTTSSLVMRKHPEDTAWPMVSGSFEPWMR